MPIFFHYLKFVRGILISKFNYQNPYQLYKIKSFTLLLTTLAFSTNLIMGSGLLLMLCGKAPKPLKPASSKFILKSVVVLRKHEAFIYLSNFINLILIKEIKSISKSYICTGRSYTYNGYFRLSVSEFSISLFPELLTVLPVLFLSKLGSYLKLSCFILNSNSI